MARLILHLNSWVTILIWLLYWIFFLTFQNASKFQVLLLHFYSNNQLNRGQKNLKEKPQNDDLQICYPIHNLHLKAEVHHKQIIHLAHILIYEQLYLQYHHHNQEPLQLILLSSNFSIHLLHHFLTEWKLLRVPDKAINLHY